MTSTLSETQSDITRNASSNKGTYLHQSSRLMNEELSETLRALAMPFDLAVVQWRITEWSDDGTRGLMLPYADPRAYSDRLNDLFSPAGWSRKYTVQASAPVQRRTHGPAAKILVTCEVTIACIGINSGTGEEWSDKENALTAAEAQAFKRSLSCFGLGRYLYDVDGEWVDLDQHGAPTRIPKLPRWATPNGWFAAPAQASQEPARVDPCQRVPGQWCPASSGAWRP
jgi:hypothetical protein